MRLPFTWFDDEEAVAPPLVATLLVPPPIAASPLIAPPLAALPLVNGPFFVAPKVAPPLSNGPFLVTVSVSYSSSVRSMCIRPIFFMGTLDKYQLLDPGGKSLLQAFLWIM
jgi:hypothetical protein